MAVSTLNQLITGYTQYIRFYKTSSTAEAAQLFHSSFRVAGFPAAITAPVGPTVPMAGVAITGYNLASTTSSRTLAGCLPMPWLDDADTRKIYLSKMEFKGGNNSTYILVDRLWHQAQISVTATTGQTINSVPWAPRCASKTCGGEPNASGYGIMVGIEVSTDTTNAGVVSTITMSYTNSDGVAGRVAAISGGLAFPATCRAGTFIPFALQAGDEGVSSIQTITLGTSLGGGVIALVAYRPIATVIGFTNQHCIFDAIQLGRPEIFKYSALGFLYSQYPIIAGGITYSVC